MDPFDTAKPNCGTKREETILQSPRHAPPRHQEHDQVVRSGGGTHHQTKSRSPTGKQRGARSPRGPPMPRHTMHLACVYVVPCVPTRSWRGGWRVPHAGDASGTFAHTRAQARGDHIKC